MGRGRHAIDRKFAELETRLGPERARLLAHRNFNVCIFPNMAIIDTKSTTVRTINPVAPGKMLVRNQVIAPIDEEPLIRRFRMENMMEFMGPSGFGTPDDVAAFEACQNRYEMQSCPPWNDVSGGIVAGADPGMTELSLRAFWREWNRRMLESGLTYELA